jgi:hypothetical protein
MATYVLTPGTAGGPWPVAPLQRHAPRRGSSTTGDGRRPHAHAGAPERPSGRTLLRRPSAPPGTPGNGEGNRTASLAATGHRCDPQRTVTGQLPYVTGFLKNSSGVSILESGPMSRRCGTRGAVGVHSWGPRDRRSRGGGGGHSDRRGSPSSKAATPREAAVAPMPQPRRRGCVDGVTAACP